MPQTQPYTEEGALIVRAVTAGGALPVEGASVTVYGADAATKDVRFQSLTDLSGQSAKLTLPAPSASLSRVPGNATPYASYDITVQKDGYYLHKSFGVPVFADVVSVQTVELIPQSYSGGEFSTPNTFDGEAQTTGPNEGGNGGA